MMICTDCPLHEQALTNCMGGAGPLDAEYLVVGQGPGGHEDLAATPFVGKAGKLLRALLGAAGLNVLSVRFTNATRCRAPGDRKPVPAEIDACRRHLKDEIHAVRPKVIIALGDVALQALCKKSGVMGKRGQSFPLHGDFEYECEVWPTYHPAYVLRVPQAKDTVLADLRRVRDRAVPREEVRWEWDNDVSFYGPPPADAVRATEIAWDIETDYDKSVKGSGHNITQLAFAACDAPAVVTRNKGKLKVIARSTDMTVTHNGWAFDVPIAYENGYRMPWGRDTLVMGYLDDETQPLGLEAMAVKYLGAAGWKEGKAAALGSDEFALYNARDAYYTLRLYQTLLSRLGDRVAIADKIILPAYLALRGATERGIYINGAAVAAARGEFEVKKANAIAALWDWGIEKPGSNAQLAAALIAEGFYLPFTPSGAYKVDKTVLQALPGELPALILDYRRATKALGTFIGPYERAAASYDGRIHPSWNLWRTLTGRASASHMNLDRRFKAFFAAPPGKVRISADYSAIEFRLGAWCAGETSILERYQKDPNWDPHRYFASLLYNKPEADVTGGANGERQIAKSANFSQLFMGEGETLRQYAEKMGIHLTRGACDVIHKQWHKAFPGFKAYYAKIKADIARDGYVESATGRRRHFGDVRLMGAMQRLEAQRMGTNMPVQSLAFDLAAVALGRLADEPLVDFVHDSIALEVDDDLATIYRTKEIMKEAMTEYAPEFLRREFGVDLSSIPLTVDFTETRCNP